MRFSANRSAVAALFLAAAQLVAPEFSGASGLVELEPPVSYPAGELPYAVTLADLDRDGDLDAVVSCATSRVLTVSFNNGLGVFSGRVDYPVGRAVHAVAADLDGDGWPDLVSANFDDGSISILRNLGSGVFTSSRVDVALDGGGPRAVVAADLDRDGDLDLAVARHEAHDVKLLANTGGTFAVVRTMAVGVNAKSIVAADLDGDGTLELVTGNSGADNVSVLRRQPDGSYQRQDLTMGSFVSMVVVADLNGDNAPDLATANSGTVSVRLQLAGGGFGGPTAYSIGTLSQALAVADLDEDGDLDLAAANYGEGNVSLLINNGTGMFPVRFDFPTSGSPRGIAAGDLNDGVPDLVTANATSPSSFSVLRNIRRGLSITPAAGGAGTIVAVSGSRLGGSTAVTMGGSSVVYQVLSDSLIEVTIPAGARTGRFRVITPIGIAVSDSVFIVAPSILSVFPSRAPPGAEVAIRGHNFTGTTAVLFNGTAANFQVPSDSVIRATAPTGASDGPITVTNAGGSDTSEESFRFVPPDSVMFDPAVTYAALETPYAVALADMDRDGDLDAVISCSVGQVVVAMNDGKGGFGTPVNYPAGNPVHAIVVDLDGDGWLDVVTANHNQGSVTILRNQGGGVLGSRADVFLPSPNAHAVAAADLDRDGDLDLAVAGYGGSAVHVLTNAAGSFVLGRTVGLGSRPVSIVAADLDGDGGPELISGNIGGEVSVLRRSGDGSYQRQDLMMAPGVTMAVAADLSGDGALDLAAVTEQGTAAVRLNLGTGSFGDPWVYTVGPPSPDWLHSIPSLAVADLDRDGDLDLAVPNHTQGLVAVLMNAGEGAFPTRWDFPTHESPRGIAAGDLDGDQLPDLVTTNSPNPYSFSVLLNIRTERLAFAPQAGAPGTNVTLSSPGIGAATLVRLAGLPVEFRVIDDSSLEVTIPGDARTGQFRVRTPTGTVVSDSIFIVAPRIFAVFPLRAPVGSQVTVRGHNFTRASAVHFSNMAAAVFQALSDSLIHAQVPADATDGPIMVTNPGGSDTSDQSFLIVATDTARFEAPLPQPAGAVPHAIKLADLDRDGDLDAVVAGVGGALSVALNPGDGAFAGRVDYPVGVALDVAIADFDGDGWPDLATTNREEGSISVLRNLGGGVFGPKGDTPLGGGAPSGIVAADFDGDGDHDLAVARFDVDQVLVLGNAAGRFLPLCSIAVGDGPRPLAAGDLDNDGAPDLIAGSYDGRISVAYFGAGGSYHREDLAMGGRVSSVLAADLNADGALDLAAASEFGVVAVRLNLGARRFSDVTHYPVGDLAQGLAAADFDRDGDLDLAVSNYSAGTVSVLMNVGEGAFPTRWDFPAGANPRGIAAGDLDGGAHDLVVANGTNPGSFSILFNARRDGLSISPLAGSPGTIVSLSGPGVGAATSVVQAGLPVPFRALDDSHLELTIPIGARTGRFRVQTPAGTLVSDSVFIVAPRISSIFPSRAPVLSDVTVRGHNFTRTIAVSFAGASATFHVASDSVLQAEVPASAENGPITVTNPGGSDASDQSFQIVPPDTASFEQIVSYPASAQPLAIALADLDRDGDLDAVVTCISNVVNVAMNRGDGTFAPRVDYPMGEAVHTAVADFDGDNWLDFAVAAYDGSVLFRRNLGGGVFGPRNDVVLGGGTPAAVVATDLDGDGDADLAVARDAASDVQVLSNTAGAFTVDGSIAVAANPRSIAAADLDGDDTPELVTGGAGGVSVLRRMVGGSYQREDLAMSGTVAMVVAADLNGDGAPDLASANSNGTVTVRLQLAEGGFTVPALYTVGAQSNSLVATDADLDGDLDLAVANYGEGSVSVLMNVGEGAFPTRWDFPAGVTPLGIAAGDLDGGAPDLVVARYTTPGAFQILLNLQRGGVAISPLAGPPATIVTLSGAGLGGATSVTLVGASLPFIVRDESRLEASIPDHARTGRFRVQLPAGAVASDSIFIVAPRIFSIFPSRGPVVADVMVRGHNFTRTTSVAFNGLAATFDVPSDSVIQARVPANATQGPITVANPGGSDSSDPFLIVPEDSVAFEPPAVYPSGVRPVSIALGDLDGDADLDAAVTCAGGALTVVMNQGDGTFAGRVDYPMGEAVYSAVADFDGDGLLDVATTNYSGGNVSILRNLGAGAFGSRVDFYIGGAAWPIVAADLDLDGDPDLAVGRSSTADVVVYHNSGGTFALQTTVAVLSSVALGAGDLDGDGTPELIAGGYPGASTLRRNADGSYQRRDLSTTPVWSVVPADLNGDGKLDLATTTNDAMLVRLNLGGAGFSEPATYSLPRGAFEAAAADLDLDGDLDLAVANEGSVSVLMNQGEGVFPTRWDFTTGTYSRAIAAGDLNGGAPDLMVATLSGSFSTLLNLRRGGLTIAPLAGAPGTIVSISGPEVGTASSVLLRGVPVPFQVIDESRLEVTIPVGARSGHFHVRMPATTAVGESVFVGAPVIRTFAPRRAAPGDQVVVSGYNFEGCTGVALNGVATTFAILSDSVIRATVPASATAGAWSVTNPGGESHSDSLTLAGAETPGVNLSWDDCGTAGTEIKSFACDTNNGADFLVVSFRPPAGITEFVGVSADLRVAATSLPDWWKFGAGQCRGPGALSPLFSFDPGACENPWSGSVAGGLNYVLGGYGGNTARISIQAANPFEERVPLSNASEYYAFRLRVAHTKSTGAGSCVGCAEPVLVRVERVQLFQPPELSNDPVLTPALDRKSAYWQAVVGADPAIASLMPTAGSPGTPVTIAGLGLTAASAVRFGEATAEYAVDSDTQISALVPLGARTAPVEVTTPFGMAASAGDFIVSVSIAYFLPEKGPAGTVVHVKGVGFSTTSAVAFNGVDAGFTVVSDTLLEVVVPPGASSGPIAITNPAGTTMTREAFEVGPSEGVFNLSWDDCGLAGSELKTFACNTNSGAPFNLIGSFVPPEGVNELIGMIADIRVTGNSLPNWWRHGLGQCRGAALLANLNFASGPRSCADFWQGKGVAQVNYTIDYYGPETALLRVTGSIPETYRGPVDARTEYYAFRAQVSRLRTVSDGACSGCDQRMALTLEQVQLIQPAAAGHNPIITRPFQRNSSYWQGVPGPAPVITAVDPTSGSPGTPVTIRGSHLAEVTSVQFVTAEASFSVASDSVVLATVPADGRTGPIVVRSRYGTAQSLAFTVAPRILSFYPRQAPLGFDPVAIFGFNFTGATAVRFGDVDASFTIPTDAIIRATVPEGVTEALISVVGPGGTAVSDSLFRVGALPPGGINLSWDDCGIAGTALKTFACDVNAGPPFQLIGSFMPPPAISAFLGLSVDLRIESFGALPDWWKHGISQCRGSSGLDVGFDFPLPVACEDAGMNAQGVMFYDVGYEGPNSARLLLTGNRPGASPTALSSEREYYAFRVNVLRPNSTGGSSCADCERAVRVALKSIQIHQPAELAFDPILVTPMVRSAVLWQGDPGPALILEAFSPPGGPPGTPVTLTGRHFADVSGVRFGAIASSFSVPSDSVLATTVPAGAVSAPLTVSSPNGVATTATLFYLPPVIRHVSPAQAPEDSTVAIRGLSLTGVSSVEFGGFPAAEFVVESDSLIRARVPAGSASGPLAITNPGGSANIPFTVGPMLVGSMNLSWDDCGLAGSELKSFACDFNSESRVTLVASFVPPETLPELIGVSAELRVRTTEALPDWWKHGGVCRGVTDLAISLDFLAGTCEDPWDGLATGLLTYEVGFEGANQARMLVSGSAPEPRTVVSGVEYAALKVSIKQSMVEKTSACPGCATPAAITLHRMQLLQTADLALNPEITQPRDRTTAYWQAVPGPLPEIRSVAPLAGAPGEAVTIQGAHLTGATTVRFGAIASAFSVPADSIITTTVPVGARTAQISVSTIQGSDTSDVAFIVAPRIARFVPRQAPEGHSILIRGVNLLETTAIAFNGAPSTFAVLSDSAVRAQVPPGATSGPITVSNPGGTATSSTAFTVGPLLPGSVNLAWDDCGIAGSEIKAFACNVDSEDRVTLVASFVTPGGVDEVVGLSADLRIATSFGLPDWWKHGGVCRGATDLAIDFDFTDGPAACEDPWVGLAAGTYSYVVGYGGANVAQLLVSGSIPAPRAVEPGAEQYAFEVSIKKSMVGATSSCPGCPIPAAITLREIELFVPAPGENEVLTTSLGRQVAYWQGVPAPTPRIVSFAPTAGTVGTPVSIRGERFILANSVRFNLTEAAYSVVSDSLIEAIVPPGTRTGPIMVTDPNGIGTSEEIFVVPPQILSFAPVQAPEGGSVTIMGLNLTASTAVVFNGIGATFEVRSDTEIGATVPIGARDGPITVINAAGSDVTDGGFRVGPYIAPGVNLSWDDCGDHGVDFKSFACDGVEGVPFSLVGSFTSAEDLPELVGMLAQVDIQTESASLPDWWRHCHINCGGTSGLSANFDFTTRPTNCVDFYQGQASGGLAYDIGFVSPNRARLRIQAAVPFDRRGPIRAGYEIYAFEVLLRRAKPAGGSSTGCEVPACILFNEVQVFQAQGLGHDIVMTSPAERNFVFWQAQIPGCPQSTPVLVSVVSTDATPNRVRLIWQTEDVDQATVHRREGDRAWQKLATVYPDGQRRLIFEDTDVQPGATYEYRLGIPVPMGETYTGETRVTVPAATAAALALGHVTWDASSGVLAASLSLPHVGPASLELFDTNGRRLGSRRLEGLGAGTNDVTVRPEQRLRPGVYFAWLRQDGEGISRRFVVLQ